MMTQLSRQRPRSPKQAASRRGAIDALLDPELFKALCDPTRVLLLGCLAKCGRACTVSEVAACCSVDLSVVSRHLQQLERAGVLRSSKEGRTVFYAVRYDELSKTLRDLADAIHACCPEGVAASNGGGCCAKP
ncbi:MAG: helix-turn-helix transcriptional regulator [Phycisphaeraceae bacterium]|nr:helix-turn-helix transcriptional regulator [Phycisphaeraceae bacterium]